MKAIKLLAVLIMGSVLVAACSSNGGKTNKNAASEIDEVSVTQIIEDIENIPTPTSIELMEMVNKLGVAYMLDVTNSLANQENYLSTKQKALNLGVYAADLSYDVAYQRKAETEEYLRCILGMASDLNISIDANGISEKFKNNIDNLESLTAVVKDLLKDSQYILNQTSQTETALLFLIGSWVESAYICVSASDLAATPSRLPQAISSIQTPFSSIWRAVRIMPTLLRSTSSLLHSRSLLMSTKPTSTTRSCLIMWPVP